MAGHAKRGSRGWDQVMLAARKQAEDYARALPVEHGYPPSCSWSMWATSSRSLPTSRARKNYAHFPIARATASEWRTCETRRQARLRAIWQDPLSLDPTRIAAGHSRHRRALGPHCPAAGSAARSKDVAEFLMRCLFTMFAEDVGLLPGRDFSACWSACATRRSTSCPPWKVSGR